MQLTARMFGRCLHLLSGPGLSLLCEPYCALLGEPHRAALGEPHCALLAVAYSAPLAVAYCQALAVAYCCALSVDISIRNAAGSSVPSCDKGRSIDKPGLSFCCRSGTDKRSRLYPAKPALIDQRCLSPLAFGAEFPLYGRVLLIPLR